MIRIAHHSRLRTFALLLFLAPLFVLLLSCGGGDSPTPPSGESGQTVRVTVATTGVSIDADGYTVRLGTRTAAVAASGTAVFDNVAAGTYQVSLEGVASNCQVQGNAVNSVTVSTSNGAQSAFSVACTVDFGDGLSTMACSELSLASASGAPMDRIAAGTLPTGLTAPLAARVLTPDGSTLGYAWFEVNEQNRLELVTPLHPSGAIAGGPVLIRATDGNAACAPVEFTITPLPASPGELGAAVDALQDVVRAQAAVLQTTPTELQSTAFADLHYVLIPLAIVQWVLDHPQNPSSLRRIANGTADVSYPLERLEALLARTGFDDSLAMRRGSALRALSKASVEVDPSTCTPAAIGDDAQRLSDCMNAGQETLAVLDGFAESIGPSLGAAALLARKTGSLLPVRGVLSALGWTAIQLELRTLALLPLDFRDERANVLLNPERFFEDDPQTGTWSATVHAESPGWDVATLFFERALRSAGNVALAQADPQHGNYYLSVDTLLAGPVKEFLPSLLIEGQTFGPVKVDDEEWSKVTYRHGEGPTAVERVEHNTYRAVAVGASLVEVESSLATSGEQRFGGRSFIGQRVVEVDSIKMRVEPSDTLMAPGATATFRVIVDDAVSDSISVGTLRGQILSLTRTSKGRFNLEYKAPANPGANNPDTVDAIHESRKGARANGPERRGFARIRFGKIDITPNLPCLDTLAEQAFSAVVTGIVDQEVRWSTDVGTITQQSGQYKAPVTRPASGYATIRATSVSEPSLVGELRVAIGCTCNYTFRLGTTNIVAEPGDRMVFTSSDNRLTGITVTRPSKSWTLRMLPIDTDPSNWPNQPGAWPIRVQGDMGLTDPADVIFSTDDEFAPLLHVESYIPRDRVSGMVSGSVDVASTFDPRILTFNWWFSIRYAPGEFMCTVPQP